ncbi:MAG: 3-phosphoshikimate 1-carboxyvinyltransferase [Rhodobacteraceae bacterium]|nr:3-phosphoshikimate 1-carboxyvinyltransferase [Paracoccaceae bacterium]
MAAHGAPHPIIAERTGPLIGTARVPGDALVCQQALVLGAMTVGETRIIGAHETPCILALVQALKSLGAEITTQGSAVWSVHGVGVGGFGEPDQVINCGSSWAGMSMIIGALATTPVTAVFTGNESLLGYPMSQITDALTQFGARLHGRKHGQLPLTVQGAVFPVPVQYEAARLSSQLKMAILMAALNAPGETAVIETEPAQDHSERMLARFGAGVSVDATPERRVITLGGQRELRPQTVKVPCDVSWAVFPVCAALITAGSDVLVPDVAVDSDHERVFRLLREMGADLTYENFRQDGDGRIADLRARFSPNMTGLKVPPEVGADLLTTYPIVAVVAAFAEGQTRLPRLLEPRGKRCTEALCDGLRAAGIRIDESGDWLVVHGRGPGEVPGGGSVVGPADYRVALSCLVMGLGAQQPVHVAEGALTSTGFDRFTQMMAPLGATIRQAPA